MDNEYQFVVEKVKEDYSISNVLKVEKNDVGWNTNYVLYTDIGKFFLKTFGMNSENNHSEEEVVVCDILNKKGIKTSNFLKNSVNDFISSFDSQKQYHIQYYIEGDTWEKNTAPEWLMKQGIEVISRIHFALRDVPLKTRKAVDVINDKQFHVRRIEHIIYQFLMIKELGCKDKYIQDLQWRLDFIKNCPMINLEKLTFVNGHSDYSITQILTMDDKIEAVIDLTETSSIPAIWEMGRFYLNSVDNCIDDCNYVPQLKELLDIYSIMSPLTDYDYKNIFSLNILYMVQAVSAYERFLKTRNSKFLERIKLRNQKISRLFCMKDMFKGVWNN